MSTIQTIFKNMSWLLISQIVVSVFGFVWTILLARYLGVDNYGILGFAISITGILGVIDDLGISTYTVRHISTDYESAPKYLGNTIPLKVIFSGIKLILTFIILVLLNVNQFTIFITLLFSIESIFISYANTLYGTFQAFEKGKYQGICNILMNTITLIFILISIFADLGLEGVTFAYILANLINLIYAYYILNKHIVKPKYEFDWDFCKKVTLASIPFAVTGILYTIYYSIDIIMLTNMIGDYATGIYNATYKLISVLTLFYSVYTAVIFPVMSRLFKNDKKLLIISYEKSIKYLMLIIIPIAIGTMLYSSDIIQLIYGHAYNQAASVLSILIWTVCLLYMVLRFCRMVRRSMWPSGQRCLYKNSRRTEHAQLPCERHRMSRIPGTKHQPARRRRLHRLRGRHLHIPGECTYRDRNRSIREQYRGDRKSVV